MAKNKQSRISVGRRSYLKLTSIAAVSTAFADTSSAVPADIEDQYDSVIDVTDEGADPSGDESVASIIDELASNDTLLEFPSGEYYIDRRIRVTGCNNFGMIGDDATLIPATFDNFDDTGDWNYKLFRLGTEKNPVTDLRVENFTVDMTRGNTGVRAIEAAADDGLLIRDIDVVGQHDTGAWGPGRMVITASDGTGLVERFTAPDGAVPTGETPGDKLEWGPTGILSNTNKGTLTFRDCVLGSFPDHGLYVSNGSGSIQVEGGRFENSFGANVRLGGTDSYIEDATIVIDTPDGVGRPQQGLRFVNGENVVARNVDIRITVTDSLPVWIDSTASGSHLNNSTITVRTDGATSGITIRPDSGVASIHRCDITHETGGSAAVVIGEGDNRVKLSNTKIRGQAETNGYYTAIYNSRNNTLFLDLDVDHGGDSGRHALTNTGTDSTIRGGTYISESHAIVESGNGTLIQGVTARSRRGVEGLQITESAENVTLRNNTIKGGVEDDR